MVGYLQCQESFKERLIIGPSEETVVPASETETRGLAIIGHYSYVNDHRIMFYRWDGVLHLRFGDGPSIVAGSIVVERNCTGDVVTSVIRKGGQEILHAVYPLNPRIKNLPYDPTPFVEAEHFDFFLFVKNVLSDSARAGRIYRSEKEDIPPS